MLTKKETFISGIFPLSWSILKVTRALYIEVEFTISPEKEKKNYSPEEVSEYDDWGFDRDLLEMKKTKAIVLLTSESCKK